MKTIRITLITIFAFTGITCVQAALIERDFASAGDAALTYDSQSGLEWLDLPLTAGVSFNQVSTLLAPGQVYEGFRLATANEVAALYQHAGIFTLTNGGFVDTGESDQVLNLIGLLGQTGFPSDGFPGPTLRGLFDAPASPGTHLYAAVGIREIDLFTVALIVESLGPTEFPDDLTNVSIGSFLVRDAVVVPLPGAVFLLLGGLGSLVTFGRKRECSH